MINIGKIIIDNQKPPLIIPEMGINHSGSFAKAIKIIRSAKRAGAQLIKNQTHLIDDEYSLEAKKLVPKNANKNIYELIKDCSFSIEEEYKLKNFTEKLGMEYISTPFSRAAVDRLVKLKVNHKLIKFVIDWQLNHAKPRTAKTKQRNEIKGSTKKIVPQKGGGGARHASKKAPLFVGGGVAHGPKGAVYKVKKINKKVRKLALAQTLSKKNFDKNLHILADVKKEIKKTKEFNKFLIKNNLANVLIISDADSIKNINKSARNIKNVKLIKQEGTNIYDLFKYKNIVITSTSAKKIQERVLNEKN